MSRSKSYGQTYDVGRLQHGKVLRLPLAFLKYLESFPPVVNYDVFQERPESQKHKNTINLSGR